MKLRPAILVVSDSAAKDLTTDKSAPILREVFTRDGNREKWEEPVVEIVPDDVLEIQRWVVRWSRDVPDAVEGNENKDRAGVEAGAEGTGDGDKELVNLIVTTGGTGFARKDFTPEARDARRFISIAMMSRPVAGVRNKTLIITLPGSPKGAKENLEAVLKFLPHACKQAAGEDSRQAHAGGVKKLEEDAGVISAVNGAKSKQHVHSHDHSHHHDHVHGDHKIPKAHTSPSERPHQSNDPRLGATHRARSSPYPMLTVAEAVSKILRQAPSPVPMKQTLTPAIVGSILAEDIYAAEAVPAYRASIVDGYAVIVPEKELSNSTTTSKAKGIKGTFPVASVSHAQASSLPPPLKRGEIARITTGAPLPDNANAVVMVEDTVIASTTPDGKEEATVEILTDELEIGENVREPGSDIKSGSLVLKRGTTVTSIGGEIGVLAASGVREVLVYRRPRVGIMSTGDEVTDIEFGGKLEGGMIRDSNRPSLLSTVRGWGLCHEVVDLGIARDTPHGQLEEKLRDGFRTHGLDVVVTTGGVSMGELDLLKPTIERSMGGKVHFGRVSMKPGKPTTFASVPFKESGSGETGERLIFGLPGNPASAIVTAHLFLLPCLQKMCGKEGSGLERITLRVAEKVKCDKARVEYHRVVVTVDREGKLVANSTGMQRSSRVGSLASANALLVLPQKEGFVNQGEMCEALMMGPLLGY